jgi:hypothetical protein
MTASLSKLQIHKYMLVHHSSRAVFCRSNSGIVGSNPIQGMDVCVRLFCVCRVLCVVAALRHAEHLSKESHCLCKKENEIEEETRAQQRAVEILMNEICLVMYGYF